MLNTKRTQIYLTEIEINYLKTESEQKQITMSELIRRILDEWINKKKLS